MKLATAAVVATAALLLPAAQAAEQKTPSPVLRLVNVTPGVTQLAWFDPLTLAKLSRPTLALDGYGWMSSFSPDRSTLVIATRAVTNGHASDFKLRFVGLADMRVVGELQLPDPFSSGAWVRADRLIGVLGEKSPRLAVIDPTRYALLRTIPLPGTPSDVNHMPGGLVLLLKTPGVFAPAVIAVADADGGLRTVTLDRISIGTVGYEDRVPGLAVDRAHRRAFVVGDNFTVAVVNLDTLAVSYHAGAKRTLAKLTGSVRQALWLGNGLLAVTGRSATFARSQPLGLRLVDTRVWKTRIVGRWIDDVERGSGDALFVARSEAAPWLAYVYSLRGKLRYRADVGTGGWVALVGPYGYVCFQGTVERVISASTGRTVHVIRGQRPDCAAFL